VEVKGQASHSIMWWRRHHVDATGGVEVDLVPVILMQIYMVAQNQAIVHCSESHSSQVFLRFI